MTEENQNDIIKKAIDGDVRAFSLLLEEHYMMIYNMAFKWAGKKEDAEDITQDVCIKLGTAIKNFKMESKFSSLLYRIVLNSFYDFCRKHKKTRTAKNIDDLDGVDAGTSNDCPEQDALNNQLWKLVRTLPDKQRDAVLLAYAEGLTHAEISEVMGVAEKTISWYIHEAKKQLHDMMNIKSA